MARAARPPNALATSVCSDAIDPDEIPKIIFAARDPADVLAMVADTEPTWVFLLGGNAGEVLGASKLLSDRGFKVFVHVDMLHGITNDGEGIRLLANLGHPAGVITTHPSAVIAAKKVGLLAPKVSIRNNAATRHARCHRRWRSK